MQAIGLVVEYNPFHNGHLYHVQQSKKETGADIVVAVMSGNFLQRGEPALVDKWYRTKMALQQGVDLVIELPYVYSTALANDFAKGAIFLLDAIGCSHFSFGSESGSLTPFLNTYSLISGERNAYDLAIHEAMQQGMSYPSALQTAYKQLQKPFVDYLDLAQPNNILGYHYVEAAASMQLNIKPYTIQRIEANYHDEIDYDKQIASATGIRKALFQQQSYKNFLPDTSLNSLTQWQQAHTQFIHWETFWPLLQYAIARHTPEQLTMYADVSEGLQYAIKKHAATSGNYVQFIQALKSKRYTWTRLQRMLTHIYTGITKEQLHQFDTPEYIRLLGMTSAGQRFLSEQKKKLQYPLISRVGKADHPMLALDIHAASMYSLGVQQVSKNKISEDYQSPPIRLL